MKTPVIVYDVEKFKRDPDGTVCCFAGIDCKEPRAIASVYCQFHWTEAVRINCENRNSSEFFDMSEGNGDMR